MSKNTIAKGENVVLTIPVSNVGQRDGEEAVSYTHLSDYRLRIVYACISFGALDRYRIDGEIPSTGYATGLRLSLIHIFNEGFVYFLINQ